MICRKCKDDKDVSEFHKESRKESGYATACKSCKKEIDKASYERRKDKIGAQKKQKISVFREEYKILKEGICCAKCGETKPYMLDFHHKDGEVKRFNIGEEAWRTLSVKKVRNEIKKCEVFCSNHHREFHYLNRESGVTLKEYLKNKYNG